MAFESSSFDLFEDSGLTIPFSGLFSLIHYTDLSDNPQDFTLYLGSNLATSQLQAASNPGVDDIVLTPTDILPEWEATTAYTAGQIVQPVGGNTFVYICTVTGTSNSSEPTWPVTPI